MLSVLSSSSAWRPDPRPPGADVPDFYCFSCASWRRRQPGWRPAGQGAGVGRAGVCWLGWWVATAGLKRAGRSSMSSDAIVVLKADHKEIRNLFRKFQAAGDNAVKKKSKIVGQIIELLTVHTYIENEVMYPEV